MSRSGTGYSYIGATEVSSAYCPICTVKVLAVPASIKPRNIYSHDLCCCSEHMKLYQARVKAVCTFILETTAKSEAVQRHMRSGNITDTVGRPLANIIDVIEIVKGKVQLRKGA